VSKARILIADDDPQTLKVIRLHLEHAGYTVTCAQDAYAALAAARQNPPDVLVLDVNMPAGNGFSVQERISKLEELSGIPVIYVTGERSSRVTAASRYLGAFAVIHKPFGVADLLEQIKLAISGERSTPRPVRL